MPGLIANLLQPSRLTGFAKCDGEGCEEEHVLKIGLASNSMLYFDAKQLTPAGWQVQCSLEGLKLYCPICCEKQAKTVQRRKLTVVSS